jgi:hypothetical protein
MDGKNWEAVAHGPERILARFANLRTPLEFLGKYGDLHPGLGLREYLIYAQIFRQAWDAKTKAQKEYVSQHITKIFEREEMEEMKGLLPPLETKSPDETRLRPAIVADFESGQISIKPRTLLDWLAKWLLEYRDKLAVCERDGCEHPYFVKKHARQRFCSSGCANSMREQKKKQWWAENREPFLKKWRQERKSAKRRKRA